jgi:hypothetical protein
MIDEGASMTLLIAELEAWLPQGAGAERYVRPLAEALLVARRAATEQGVTLRILPDHHLTGEPGADFLLQADDYDVRLKLLPAVDVAGDPAPADVAASLLAANPGTVAVVLVRTAADLPAVAVTAGSAQLPARRPLPDVLRALIGAQVAVWDVPPDEPGSGLAGRALDIHQVFQSAIAEAFDAERTRSYRTEARKEAARALSIEDETAVILDALDRALAGAPAAALTPLLTRTASQRGASPRSLGGASPRSLGGAQ